VTDEQRRRLAEYRSQLDSIDDSLLELLLRRATLVEEVWTWKQAHGLPRSDAAREAAMKSSLADAARAKGLDPDAVRPIVDAVIGKKLLG
jgi:chorismate mutase/prephenate dehydrogenase